jgi:hypothetical protein
VIIKSVRLRGRLFAAMLRGSNEDAALVILRWGALDRMPYGAGLLVFKHRAKIAHVEPALKEVK